ncbi:hypothetical protein TNCV_3285071 [Trichonephila clavipes]|nr:hypothetical protein TNCV_3285071 [Trichonephila clavipes]
MRSEAEKSDRCFEHHTGDCTISIRSTLVLWNTGGQWSGAYHLVFPTTNISSRRISRVPLCLTGTIRLKTSMPSPGFEASPYGTAVSVTLNTIYRMDVCDRIQILALAGRDMIVEAWLLAQVSTSSSDLDSKLDVPDAVSGPCNEEK